MESVKKLFSKAVGEYKIDTLPIVHLDFDQNSFKYDIDFIRLLKLKIMYNNSDSINEQCENEYASYSIF